MRLSEFRENRSVTEFEVPMSVFPSSPLELPPSLDSFDMSVGPVRFIVAEPEVFPLAPYPQGLGGSSQVRSTMIN